MSKFAKTISAVLMATTVGAAALTAPAQANGQLSVHINPSNAEQARLMQLGLGVYGLVNEIERNGGITQRGRNNSAGVAQNGRGNFGVVHQDGKGHQGSLEQNGHGNSYGLFQFGRNTNANVRQNGHGQSGLGFVFGW